MGEAFTVGSRVNARGLACEVIEVSPLGTQLLLRLRCVTGDLAGLEWGILHPTEAVTCSAPICGPALQARWIAGGCSIRRICWTRY